MNDVVIVGGGVVGLSVAWELASEGVSVHVIDRQPMGREASWAGAGMIPPGEVRIKNPQYRHLTQVSSQLWPDVANRLREETGLDNEYHVCGAILFAREEASAEEFAAEQAEWSEQGVQVRPLDAAARLELEPAISETDRLAFELPEQAQVRNPRHLQGLQKACLNRGVKLTTGTEVRSVRSHAGKITAVVTDNGEFTAEKFLWATGAWTHQVAELLDYHIPVVPIRGQIVLLNTARQLSRILEEGKRYLVPRLDGRLLIGSTEEHVGFERAPSDEQAEELRQFGSRLVHSLSEAEMEQTWCGFRPATPDLLPILDRLPNWENGFIATGHYRAGLSLAPVTALVMRQLLLEEDGEMPIDDFAADRFSSSAVPAV